MAKFKVDTEVVNATIKTYKKAIEDINKAISDAEKAIEVLKNSGWKTNASKEFFNNFDGTWKVNVEKRIEVLKHLKDCLEDAEVDYNLLYDSASNIGSLL